MRTLRNLVRYGAVVVFACLLAFSLARTDWVRSLENTYYDYWHLLSGVRYQPRHTVFISIDDETLAALKDDPLVFWAPHFARVMDTLAQAGVKVVGLDVLYQVSAESWLKKLNLPDSAASRNFDSPLRAALAKGDTILITQLVDATSGNSQLLLPPEDHLLLLPTGMHGLGVGNLFPDNDKRIRHFYPPASNNNPLLLKHERLTKRCTRTRDQTTLRQNCSCSRHCMSTFSTTT